MIRVETKADLDRIVDERLEEATTLEFKRQLPPSGSNDDVSKDLAAMANTEGGLIVYGIEQDEEGRASALWPIPLTGTSERISLVARSLDEPLDGVGITTIAHGNGEGFIVVEVSRSTRAPHLFRGTAWGRTAKGNTTLSRRRVGELFARNSGFAEEFGLRTRKPGRVMARFLRDERSRSAGTIFWSYYIRLENDGESDVLDVKWEWISTDENSKGPPNVITNPCPIDRLPSGATARVSVTFGTIPADLRVRTTWRDATGSPREMTLPATWS